MKSEVQQLPEFQPGSLWYEQLHVINSEGPLDDWLNEPIVAAYGQQEES